MKILKNLKIHLSLSIFLSILKQTLALEPANLPAAPYTEWANQHWVWLHHSEITQQNLEDLVQGYQDRGIQVNGVNIDSGWSTGYNNFIWDKTKFPDPEAFVNRMHNKDIKVMCWMTSFINEDSSNFQYAYDNNYLLNNGTIINWWHGNGGLLDYTNPDALDWWNIQLKKVLDIGVDGWKLDGSDPYIFELLPQATGYAGVINHREYADLYYGNTLSFTREIRGKVGLTMARPVALMVPNKLSYWFYLTYSPADIVYSGWVGDQDGNWTGLKSALAIMFHSAAGNATNFGSDIGGYRKDKTYEQGRSKQVFIRWAQMGALVPLMENGGGGDHTPWSWDQETVDIYQKFVNIHYELFPFFYSAGSQANEQGLSVMQPVKPVEDKMVDFSYPTNFDYTLWNDIHISPIYKDTEQVTVTFPEKSDGWVDYWTQELYEDQKLKKYPVPLDKYAIFLRRGSIIPMNISKNGSIYGSKYSSDYLTLVISYPVTDGSESGQIREYEVGGMKFQYSVQRGAQGQKILLFTGTPYGMPLILIFTGVSGQNWVEDVQFGSPIDEVNNLEDFQKATGQRYYQAENTLYVKLAQSHNYGWEIQVDDIVIEENLKKINKSKFLK